MAECSQEFNEMLDAFYEEAYEDGQHYEYMSGLADEKKAAILEYVARMEASHKTLMAVYGIAKGSA